jgi:hypothetical protein
MGAAVPNLHREHISGVLVAGFFQDASTANNDRHHAGVSRKRIKKAETPNRDEPAGLKSMVGG